MPPHAPPPQPQCNSERGGSTDNADGGTAARASQNGSNVVSPEYHMQSDAGGSTVAAPDASSPRSPPPGGAASKPKVPIRPRSTACQTVSCAAGPLRCCASEPIDAAHVTGRFVCGAERYGVQAAATFDAHPGPTVQALSGVSRSHGVSMHVPAALHVSSSMPDLTRAPKVEALSPRAGMRNGSSALPDAPVHGTTPPIPRATDLERTASPGGKQADAHNLSDMCQAIELLHVVQQDQGWQAAERQGGSLNGGAAALLSALQSPATEGAVLRANNHGLAARGGGGTGHAPRAPGPARSSSSGGGGHGSGGNGAAPLPPRMKRSHGSPERAQAAPLCKPAPSGPEVAAVAAGEEPGAGLIGAEHRQFGFPGGGTFVRVPQQPGAHSPGHRPPSHASLQDKLLRVEATSIGASTAGGKPPPPARDAHHTGGGQPHAGASGGAQAVAATEAMFAAQAQAAWADATAATVTAPAAPTAGTSLHPSVHNAVNVASIHSTSLPPGSLRGSMHGGPLAAGAPLTGSASLSAVDITNAPPDIDPTELKALRNRVNRADGGIGRKLTLDVLKLQFGKGLKEAAECLGMCPTTLKRACRRLGVKRWPRTPEAATQVLTEAQEAQRAMAAAVPPGFVTQFAGGLVGGGGSGGAHGLGMSAGMTSASWIGSGGLDDTGTAGIAIGMGGADVGGAADDGADLLLMDGGETGADNLGEFDDFLEMWGTE